MALGAFTWGDAGAQLTPAQIAARRKIADTLMQQGGDYSPVKHWTQGMARVANALMGGMMARDADQADKANVAANQKMIADILSGGAGGSASISPASPTAALPNLRTANVPEKIYEADEPSPLDPPSGPDRDAAIRTIIAESGNQPSVGQQAVAAVIRNRAVDGGFGGNTPGGVVQTPNQFEPWNTEAGRSRMASIDPNSPQYQTAAAALDKAYFGDDPTGGATHFFAPKAQAALGRDVPAWGRAGGQDIGDHRFFGGKGTAPVQVAGPVPSPDALPPTAQPAQGFAVPGAPAAPQPSGISPAIINALTDPRASETTRAMAQAMFNKAISRNPTELALQQLQLQKAQKDLDASPTVQRIKQPDGSEVAVQWDAASKSWAPLAAPQGGNPVTSPKLTEQQSKDVGFYNRGKSLIPRLEQQDTALTDLMSAGGGQISNYFKSDAYRQAEQTGQELLAVILRKDTGAAVTETEMQRYGNIYLPKPGDDQATIDQKRVARATAIEGLRMGLGPAEIIFRSQEAADAAKAQTTKVRRFNPQTGKIE